MANDGHGSGRVVLVGRPRAARPAAASPPPPPEVAPVPRRLSEPVVAPPASREGRPRARARAGSGGESHWTARRLLNGALLAGLATVGGGLIFQKNFRLFGDNHSQLLAMGFGLFVVGMVVLTLCLIGLAALAVRAIVAGQGWPGAIVLGFAPTVPLVALNMLGVLSYAFPAFYVIIVAGGFALALKQA